MDNQQLDLSNEQLQVIVSGKFGGGCLTLPTKDGVDYKYTTNCKYREYLEFKKELLGDLCANNIGYKEHNGYSQTEIYSLQSKKDVRLTYLRNLGIEESLDLLDDLGVAMWIYDDGSLHKDKLFYNINTQAFDREVQEELFVPFFNKLNIFPKVTIERKKDGREFWYLRISKYEGSYEISNILENYPIECYNYKRWSSETIQRWSKLLEELKSTGITIKDLNNHALSRMMKKIVI